MTVIKTFVIYFPEYILYCTVIGVLLVHCQLNPDSVLMIQFIKEYNQDIN